MQQQSNGDDTRSDGAPEPGDASRGWQRTKRWSDSESWHLCRASLWSRWHGLAHGSWLRLALRTGDHCAVDLTSCWIGDPVGFEKEEGLCGTLHGARTRCLHEGLGTEPQPSRLPVPSILRPLLLRLRTATFYLMRPYAPLYLVRPYTATYNRHQLTVITLCIYLRLLAVTCVRKLGSMKTTHSISSSRPRSTRTPRSISSSRPRSMRPLTAFPLPGFVRRLRTFPSDCFFCPKSKEPASGPRDFVPWNPECSSSCTRRLSVPDGEGVAACVRGTTPCPCSCKLQHLQAALPAARSIAQSSATEVEKEEGSLGMLPGMVMLPMIPTSTAGPRDRDAGDLPL